MKKIDVEQVVVGVLIIVLVVLVVVYVNKNNEGFEGGGKPKLYFFYVDWCPHCQDAKDNVFNDKEWNKLENKNKVELIKVNCEGSEEEKALAKENNVKAYPTVVLDNNGDKTELDSGVTPSSVNTLLSNF